MNRNGIHGACLHFLICLAVWLYQLPAAVTPRPIQTNCMSTTGANILIRDVIDEFEAGDRNHTLPTTYLRHNEEMYPVIEAGARQLRCRMPIRLHDPEDERKLTCLPRLNFDNIPNIKNIDPALHGNVQGSLTRKTNTLFRTTWGTVGILYNTKLMKSLDVPAPTKWADLWDERL